jgi:hypothetical protein
MTCCKGTVLGQPDLSGARTPTWPTASCSVISADAVAGVLHKPVTARPQEAITTCDYLTGGPDDISINTGTTRASSRS